MTLSKHIAGRSLALLLLLTASLPATSAEREVSFENAAASVTLHGTLTVPDGVEKPAAVVVMVSGSGWQDRDETVMGHKPFKALAEAMAAAGIASLRYDDRLDDMATTADFASDAACALAYAGEQTGARAGLLGHSEGGLIACMLADSADFIVTMGAPAFRGDSIILWQTHAALALAGQENEWAALYPTLRARYDMLMGPMPAYAAYAALYADVARQYPMIDKMPALKEQLVAQAKAMTSPWYRQFLRTDPADAIRGVKVPWLALGGGKDMQVGPDNLERIAALNPAATVRLMPDLNHLMLKAPTGSPAEYASLQGDIDPQVADAVVDFVKNLK